MQLDIVVCDEKNNPDPYNHGWQMIGMSLCVMPTSSFCGQSVLTFSRKSEKKEEKNLAAL